MNDHIIPRPGRVERRMIYITYGARLEIHPRNGLTVEQCRNKAVLYIIRWVKDKIGEGIPKSLLAFPEVGDYASFDIKGAGDISMVTPVEMSAFYWNDTWAMRFVESQEVYPGDFITDISLECKEETVSFAIRTQCRQSVSTKYAKSYRPAFISRMVEDEDMVLTEEGIPDKYPVSTEPIRVNGKSNSELTEMYTGLVDVPGRLFSVAFYPEPEDEEGWEMAKRIAKTLMGYAYVVIIEGSLRKFFLNVMQCPSYISILEEKKTVLHNELVELEDDDQDPVTWISGIFDVDEELEDKLQDVKHEEPVKWVYDFSGVRFPAQLRSEYGEARIAKARESGSDQEVINALEESNAQLKSRVEELSSELDETKERSDSLQKQLNKTKADLLNEERQHKKTEKKLDNAKDGSEKEAKQKEEDIGQLERKLKNLENIADIARDHALRMVDTLTVFEGADDASKYINWVDHFYSDTIILHERARRAIEADKIQGRDWRIICMATHFVAGFTAAMNDGASLDEANEIAAQLYDIGSNGYQVTRALSGETKARYADDYRIDISKYHEGIDDETNAELTFHVTDHQEYHNMFRIYFYYDAKLKKSIIGYMPGHLPTASFNG